jgi:3-methyladenine DNA glycosylase/8-oxoguanine DNA glycosylase
MKEILTIRTPDEFNFRTTLISHGWLELAPFYQEDEFNLLHRIHRLDDGLVLHLMFQADEDQNIIVKLADEFPGLTEKQRAQISAATRRIFNLDLDLSDFYTRIQNEERYEWVIESGAGRLLRAPTVWEDMVKTLMTTNTNWATTRNIVRRINSLGDRFQGEIHTFPLPEQVAALTFDELSEAIRAGYRAEYLHLLSQTITTGNLDVEAWQHADSTDELYQNIIQLKGFGPYAAGSVVKLLGGFEHLALDSAIRDMFTREFNNGEKPSDAEIRAHYEPYGKWQGLVAWMDLMKTAWEK